MKLGQPQTDKRQYYLDILRAVAIISITLNHAVNRSYANYSGQMAEFYSIPLWSTMLKTVVTVFSKIGVPLFMMITGVLIMNKKMDSKEDIKRFYRHNLLSLLITTEIWYVLIYWYLVFFGNNNILENRGIWGTIGGMFETMLFQNQVTFDSLWYMPVIMCIYTTIPFVIMAKNKLSGEKASVWLFLPLIIVYLNNMVLPAVNAVLESQALRTFTSTLQMVDLVAYFYIYIILGYFVGKGILDKWKTWVVALIAMGSFALCCGFQLYMYAQPMDHLMDYDFPLLPICAAALLELGRRKAYLLKAVSKPVEGLSRISFGIYFLHIVIMTVLNSDKLDAIVHQSQWNPVLKLAYLEIVSVGASIVIIVLLSNIKPLKKYLFMIK
jgi:surface polysaccharide O-acyltransferase-like enzyme